MTKVFTADSFFIFQQSFRIFPINKLERGSRWKPSISLATKSIPDSLQMLITVFSKWSSQILFGMPDNSTLFLQLYCPQFAWFFSKFMIFFSNLLFTFFVILSSLVSFLFSNEIWSIASVSLCIWSDILCKSVSTITFPFRSNIFCTKSDFFRYLTLKNLKYWYYFHPFWLYLLMCSRKETMNLNFVENLVDLSVYLSVYLSLCLNVP